MKMSLFKSCCLSDSDFGCLSFCLLKVYVAFPDLRCLITPVCLYVCLFVCEDNPSYVSVYRVQSLPPHESYTFWNLSIIQCHPWLCHVLLPVLEDSNHPHE